MEVRMLRKLKPRVRVRNDYVMPFGRLTRRGEEISVLSKILTSLGLLLIRIVIFYRFCMKGNAFLGNKYWLLLEVCLAGKKSCCK